MTTPPANPPTPALPPRRRARRIAKWSLLAASLLVAAVFAASTRWTLLRWSGWHAEYEEPFWLFTIERGAVRYFGVHPGIDDRGTDSYWSLHRSPGEPLLWRPQWSHPLYKPALTLPLWIPFALLALPAAKMFYGDRPSIARRRAGQCIKCGYDRRGLAPGAVCPECGTASGPERTHMQS